MVIGFWWIALLLMILVPALGLMLIVRGLRGRVDFSSPHCRRCEYDLRWIKPDEQKHCPECGSDLTAKRAVSFGRYGRNLPMLIMGTLLLLLPIGVIITGPILTARAVQAGPAGTASKTNEELIADLSTTASQPWT